MKILQVSADHQINPVGLVTIPSFSWKISADTRDFVQASYRLQIALDKDFATPVCDQSEQSAQSVHVHPNELQLASLTAYYYRVCITDIAGAISAWSETGCFVTALLSADEWRASFITAESAADAESSKSTCLRTEFVLTKRPVRAYALTTALGLYHFYINGKKIGIDEMAPGWTSYHKHLLYQMHDITDALCTGQNAVGAMVGPGWYKGTMGFLAQRNHYGSQTAFLCQLHLWYADGTQATLCSDDGWRGADAPVTFSEIYDGEVYDATKEQPGWCTAGFAADCWRSVATLPYNMSVLTPQSGCKVIKHECLHPTLLLTPKGEHVLDFGQNLTGWPSFCAPGNRGDIVELSCFEALDALGNVYTANLRRAKQAVRYICNGDSTWYEPQFTFYGFRYIKVEQWPGKLMPEQFVAYVVHSDMRSTGTFACSNPAINQLQHNILWGMKGNFLDIPTDCPQRDERLGWTGDAQIFCPTAAYLMDTYLFFRKWLVDVSYDQTPEGGIPHVIPDIITGKATADALTSQGTHSASAWADVIVLNPWNLYLAYGDIEILQQNYAPMKRWIAFMRSHADGVLWSFELQFGDWLGLDAQPGSYNGATPIDLTCAAYYAFSTGVVAKVAAALGQEQDAADYAALHRTLVADYGRRFFTPEGELTIHTQTAAIVSLQFGLVPLAYRDKTLHALLALLQQSQGHLTTGFIGTPYFTHVLSENGCLKDAYALLLKDDFPSWLYQVKMGATTIWEHWDGIKPDGSMWSEGMNSFNHYAYGSIGEWMYRVAAGIGIDEAQPGYRHSILYPRPGGALTWVAGTLETEYGCLSSRWQQTDDIVTVWLEIPANTSATVQLGDVALLMESDGLTFTLSADGTLCAQAGSGNYVLRYRK